MNKQWPCVARFIKESNSIKCGKKDTKWDDSYMVLTKKEVETRKEYGFCSVCNSLKIAKQLQKPNKEPIPGIAKKMRVRPFAANNDTVVESNEAVGI